MHPLTIEVGPIDTVEIFDKVIVTTSEDAGMATRHPVRIDEQIAEMVATNDRLVRLQWESSDTFRAEIYLYRWHGLNWWRVRHSDNCNRGGATEIAR